VDGVRLPFRGRGGQASLLGVDYLSLGSSRGVTALRTTDYAHVADIVIKTHQGGNEKPGGEGGGGGSMTTPPG
jgi:hypothetical protein